VLGQLDLAAAEVGQRQIGNLERDCLWGHAGSSNSSLLGLVRFGRVRDHEYPAPMRSHSTTVRQVAYPRHAQSINSDNNL
jgi:hypothetical protein